MEENARIAFRTSTLIRMNAFYLPFALRSPFRKVDQHTCIPYFFLNIHSSYPFSCLSPFKILLQVFERQSGSTPVMRWSTSFSSIPDRSFYLPLPMDVLLHTQLQNHYLLVYYQHIAVFQYRNNHSLP